MKLSIYLISAFLFLVSGFIIFRVFVRRDYKKIGRLTFFSTFLEWVIFCSWGWFTYFDLRGNWQPSYVHPIIRIIAWICLVVGMAFLIIGIAKLGFRRSNGLEMNILKQTGLYRLSRNPQALACALAVVGYALFWPTWHTLGWILLYMIIVHMMVITEEENLRKVFGDEYIQYCQRVPRYIGISRKG
jgi:protein-S-isoprenylcysteine O-methyltransferase Ste14